MSRYIDAQNLVDWCNRTFQVQSTITGKEYVNAFLQAVVCCPSADVVEVVRCKDCVHWGGVTYGFFCRKLSGLDTKICMGADHFCSYGERRSEE